MYQEKYQFIQKLATGDVIEISDANSEDIYKGIVTQVPHIRLM